MCHGAPRRDQARHNGVTAAAQTAIAKFAQCTAGNRAPRRSSFVHGGNYTLKRSWRVLSGPLLVVAALFSGCAAPDPGREIPTVAHELALPELSKACNQDDVEPEQGLEGCFRWIAGACHIYILPRWVFAQRSGNLSGYHEALGHELDHCRIEYFHGEDRGVHGLPRVPILSRFSGISIR